MSEGAVLAKWFLALSMAVVMPACAPPALVEEAVEESEVLSRTEFTDRIENFFEYDALRAGQPSQFLIHLTDLDDGTPVAEARVELVVRSSSGSEVLRTTAQVGRVTGIYVTELAIPSRGTFGIDFAVENDRLSEAMALDGFEVE